MSDDLRLVARNGLAPLVEEVPKGPEWEELISTSVSTERRSAPGWLIGVAATLVVFGLIGITLLLQPGEPTPPVDSPVTTGQFDDVIEAFDAAVVVPQTEVWWDHVLAGDVELTMAMAHPDPQFTFSGLLGFLDLGSQLQVHMSREVFGTDTQPQLCFTVVGTAGATHGTLVYRFGNGEWLPWEVRPNVERCIDEDVELPVDVTSFDVVQPVPITVLASDANGLSNSLIDFEEGTIATSATSEQVAGHSSAIVDGEPMVYSWTHDGSVYENGALVLETAEPAFSMRVLRLPVRDGIWVTYTGGPNAVADLYTLSDDQRILRATVEDNAFPVGVTESGLIFNTAQHVDTGDGFITDPGTERVVALNSVGDVRFVTEGEAIAVGGEHAGVIDCPTGRTDEGNCWINAATGRTALFLIDLASGERMEVVKPSRGDWLDVGGPIIPSESMPFRTLSPDGTRLLVRLGQDIDVNGVPRTSQLVMVEMTSGETMVLAEYSQETPIATWSTDGQWVVTFWGSDVTAIEVASTANTFTYQDLIPDGQFPMAAG